MTNLDLDLGTDIIDTRDIFARHDELTASIANNEGEVNEADTAELETLTAILSDLEGNGGDEQWEGEWYPGTLIRGRYFVNYARELAEDSGMVDVDAKWPNNCIDWKQAARDLQVDYTYTEINGVAYYSR